MNRYEQMVVQKEKLNYVLQGSGSFVFRNITSGSLMLPKESADGKLHVAANEEFQGDNYFMSLVPRDCVLVRVLDEEKTMLNEEKLILDQPERVTNEGVVEQVVVDPKAKKKPTKKQQPQREHKQELDVLLNEDPMAGVQILG